MTEPNKTRVVILGAGPAALATAFDLTETEELRSRFAVTIYEQGYRAGGKCSGLRRPPLQVIEQNGTHYLFGCYDNAFDLVQKAYRELLAAGETGFGSFDEQFLARHRIVFRQQFAGAWHDWNIELPANDLRPGLGTGPLDFAGPRHLALALTWLWSNGLRSIASALRQPELAAEPSVRSFQVGVDRLLSLVPVSTASLAGSRLHVGLLRKARALGYRAARPWLERNLACARGWVLFDLAATCLIGLSQDDIQTPEDLARLNDIDLRAWLAKHGASQESLECAPLRGWYDAVAAYENGDSARPNIAAGVSLHALGRALLTYRGALFYSLRSEVADGFIAPMCAALQQRGVKFGYFHRLWQLNPHDSGSHIEAIELEQQARLRRESPFEYDPFISCNGRKAWPADPRAEQLSAPVGSNLHSFYAPRVGPSLRLERGRDFDLVVFGVPLLGAPSYAARLLEQKPTWRRALENLSSVETQSLRLYLSKSPAALGWQGKPGILSGFVPPFSTWEDNSHSLETQSWPDASKPETIASLFGALPSEPVSAKQADSAYEAQRLAEVRRNALAFLEQYGGELWPGARSAQAPSALDFEVLVDREGRTGAARLSAQYVRANVGPTERYTTASAGTLAARLAPDDSGYENLFLAGDWTSGGTGTGSVEGAVMSGRAAARAICIKVAAS